LLHGSDHGVSEFLNDELNLCVVFDVNSTGQAYIKDSTTYQAFKSKFQAVIENEMKDWRFVDAAIDPKAKYNRWHPIILLKPMLTAFEHTHTHQEQVDLITEIFGEIQSKLVGLEEFKLLVSELANSKEE
jgi:hypothetical protein